MKRKRRGEGRKEGREGGWEKRRRGREEEEGEKNGTKDLPLVVPARASRRCFVAPVLIVRNVVRL